MHSTHIKDKIKENLHHLYILHRKLIIMNFSASHFIKRPYNIFLLTFIVLKHVKVGTHIDDMRRKLSESMLIVKFYSGMKCLHNFIFVFLHSGMKFNPCLFDRDEFIPE